MVSFGKLNGKWRPLGIPAIADKVLQMGVTKILTRQGCARPGCCQPFKKHA
jgi:retron-type reverse transcriptase